VVLRGLCSAQENEAQHIRKSTLNLFKPIRKIVIKNGANVILEKIPIATIIAIIKTYFILIYLDVARESLIKKATYNIVNVKFKDSGLMDVIKFKRLSDNKTNNGKKSAKMCLV
jgi:predicted DNA-binding antitoxin AbrB/MazE fold protein